MMMTMMMMTTMMMLMMMMTMMTMPFDVIQEEVAAKCRRLRVANFNRCFKLTDKCVKALVATNRQLHDARLAQTSVSDEALKALASAGPYLRRLELAGCKVRASPSPPPSSSSSSLSSSSCSLLSSRPGPRSRHHRRCRHHRSRPNVTPH
jgi:hypothetical protein